MPQFFAVLNARKVDIHVDILESLLGYDSYGETNLTMLNSSYLIIKNFVHKLIIEFQGTLNIYNGFYHLLNFFLSILLTLQWTKLHVLKSQ